MMTKNWLLIDDISATQIEFGTREKLSRLIDADLSHTLSMTDEEVLAEAAENGENPAKVRAQVQAAVEAATTRARCDECDWEGPVAELRGDAADCPRGCSGTAVSVVP